MMNGANYRKNLTLDERLLIATVRVAEFFKREHSNVFKEYGLSFSKYNLLRALHASDKGQSRISDISRVMLVPNANITGVAKRLVQDAYIVKKDDPTDDRVTILEITKKGKEVLEAIEQEKDESLRMMLSGLTEKEKADLLKKIIAVLKNSVSPDQRKRIDQI